MVEIEVGLMVSQCMDRRSHDTASLLSELAAGSPWYAPRALGSRTILGLDRRPASAMNSPPRPRRMGLIDEPH
jgi:hypothetical protein